MFASENFSEYNQTPKIHNQPSMDKGLWNWGTGGLGNWEEWGSGELGTGGLGNWGTE